jgi:hypothetical protein
MQASNNNMINDSNDTTNGRKPSLPPLYFQEKSSKSTSTFSPLFCSELETTILSFLNWGDYARLSPVHSSLSNIVKDAANQSTEAKYTLAQSLLNGDNGLMKNASLAMTYLEELAGVELDMEHFDPSFQAFQDVDDDDAEHNNNNDNNNISSSDDNDNNNIPTSIAAMRQLANCHLTGTGMPSQTPDPTTGLAWLQKAYQHGDLPSAHTTATIYEYGQHSIPVDIYKASSWFHGAAMKGHVESMAEYAMCLELGCGVDQCDEGALDWYTKAAELGHVTAHFSVGEWFECARGGLPQSDTEAVLWYYKAAKLGDEDSRVALKRLNAIARIVVPGWERTLASLKLNA